MIEKRLIDANALVDLERLEHTWHDGEPWYHVQDVWDCIDAAPTVDAIEVIRCRDCKFFYPVCGTPAMCRNVNGVLGAGELDFCCRAERREDDAKT